MDRPLHILLVDDRPESIFLLSEFLLKRHHRVEVSGDSRESLNAIGRRRVKSDPYDLVIANARMPQIDGVGILRELRGRQDPTMVALLDPFCDIDAATQREAESLGCATFLDKPIDLGRVEALLAVVRSAVGLGAAPARDYATATPAPTDANIFQASDEPAARPVVRPTSTASDAPAAPLPANSPLALQPANSPMALHPVLQSPPQPPHAPVSPLAPIAPVSPLALQPAAPATPGTASFAPIALSPQAPQAPPVPTTQTRAKPKDEPFFGTARVVRAVGGNVERPPTQPGTGRVGKPGTGRGGKPGTGRVSSPTGGNPFTDSYPASPIAASPAPAPTTTPAIDPFAAGRTDTARLRRAVTGRVERPPGAQAVDEGIRNGALERKVVCAVCKQEFLVANRLQEFNVVCVHCGKLNRIAPRAAR